MKCPTGTLPMGKKLGSFESVGHNSAKKLKRKVAVTLEREKTP